MSSAREKKAVGRYAKLDNEMERGNQDFIDQQRHQQQVREMTERGEKRGREERIVSQLCVLTLAMIAATQFPRGHDVLNSL